MTPQGGPVLAGVAAVCAAIGRYGFLTRMRRDRAVADTPPVRLRSAAQGYVKGNPDYRQIEHGTSLDPFVLEEDDAVTPGKVERREKVHARGDFAWGFVWTLVCVWALSIALA